MIILSAQDLELYGIRSTSSTITIMGKAFVRGQTFAQRLRDAAIAIAEESLAQGYPCLLVDSETHITIWKQRQGSAGSHRSQTQSANRSVTPHQSKSVSPPPSQGVKKYRGQVVSPDSGQVGAPSTRSFNTPLTYRGRTVPSTNAGEQSNWTALNGQYSSTSRKVPKHLLSRRLMQYRGQWVSNEQ